MMWDMASINTIEKTKLKFGLFLLLIVSFLHYTAYSFGKNSCTFVSPFKIKSSICPISVRAELIK